MVEQQEMPSHATSMKSLPSVDFIMFIYQRLHEFSGRTTGK